MFEKFKVFTKAELESRVEIKYENYSKAINIEAVSYTHLQKERRLLLQQTERMNPRQ